MSTIPSRAIPQAQPEGEGRNGSSFLFDNARRLAATARENPKTALAVGAGVVAATAAATVALTRGRGVSANSGAKGRRRKS